MGDPRKHRKKFTFPRHPWNKDRLEEEKGYSRTYGLTNKREIYIANSLLKKYKSQAKKLVPLTTDQAEKEKKELLKKLQSLNLLTENATVADVLTITLKDIFERRLQTLVYRKNLARSIKQARQFITHE